MSHPGKRLRRTAMAAALCCLLLTGCASLLARTYSTSEPHSSKFWESEAADTMRAENYQDIVNDILILIGRRTESATLRLYNFKDDVTVAETMERATTEIQQETPMGAYAVEFITTTMESQRGYYEIAVAIAYRRSAEQIQAVVNATSTEALYSLLDAAVEKGRTELAVRLGYWGDDDAAHVEQTVSQVREERGLTETPAWTVTYYPSDGPVGLVEFLLDPAETGGTAPANSTVPAEGTAPEEQAAPEAAAPAS